VRFDHDNARAPTPVRHRSGDLPAVVYLK